MTSERDSIGRRKRLGKRQVGIRRALIASNGKPLPTDRLAEWAFPRLARLNRDQWRALRRAAERVAARIGRDDRGRIVYGPKSC